MTPTCNESWPLPGDSIIAFGPFQLDRIRYDLRKDGASIPIGARAMAILLELTRSPGEILSTRELLRRVWQDTVVEEGTVRVHVALLRKSLRKADPGEYVQNVTGRGYRFIAPLRGRNEAVAREGGDPLEPEPPVRVHTLPSRITSVIGREQVILTLVEKVSAHRFVTITGTGGSGKSTVAMAVAQQLAARYAHGVCLVDLAASTEARFVANALASALGVAPLAADPLPHVLECLSKRSLLLVLDNCEHVIEAAARLVETVLRSASRVHILTTSREPLRAAGEAVHDLASLEVPAEHRSYTRAALLRFPAIQLFVARAETYAGVGLNDEELRQVAEICRRLDGNPLAMEITAAHVRLIGASSLVGSLGNELLLSIDGRRTAERRHRSLRDTFDWSYGLLSLAEQATFRRLAVFAGWFDVDCAVATVADSALTEVAAFESLMGLARKSLVQVDTRGEAAAYRLLDLPRTYAREKLVEAGEADVVRHRHARMWCSVGAMQIHGHVRRGADWVGVFGPRIDDLRAATRWSFGASSGSSLRVKLTLMSLWFEFVLAAESPEQPVWPDLYAYILRGGEGSLLSGLGEFLQTSRCWKETPVQGLTVLQQIDHGRSEQKSALWSLWFERVIKRDYRIAINLSAALRERGSDGRPHESPLMDCLLALAWGYAGDQGSACRHAQWALATLSSGTNVGPAEILLKCHIYTVIARSLWLRGFPDQAIEAVGQGVEAALLAGNPSMLCTTLLIATSIAIWCGDTVSATEYLERLHVQASAHSLEYYELWADCLRMIVNTSCGSQPIESLQLSVDPLSTSQYLDILASLREDLVSRDAMVRAEAGRSGWCTSEILRVKAERLIRDSGHEAFSCAEALLTRALEIARRQHARSWELRASMSLARLWKDQGRVREAQQLLTAVYSMFTEGLGTADLRAARQVIGQLAEETAKPASVHTC
ncbi:ATP-binding protein [Povalibacter sp.]|uniref:ATP-binding protein n=1 Tax=Povalibacter sp. TaxID=1962978 RepID=UPI002F3FBF42